jgi:hypothetical protein
LATCTFLLALWHLWPRQMLTNGPGLILRVDLRGAKAYKRFHPSR